MSIWIYTDADNTLWDTDAVFAEAQLALLTAAEKITNKQARTTERLQFVRQFDQAIAINHHSRLRYPPAFLIRALARGLEGDSPHVAAQRVLTEGSVPTNDEASALKMYGTILSAVPPLLEGVRNGLQLAQELDVPVYVISEGPAQLVRERLQVLALEQLTSGALSAEKSPDLYARLKQRAVPRRALMVGDQPDRDIRFAHEAGMETILIKGRFQPSWAQSADITYADAVVQNFREAIEWAVKVAALPTV